MCQPRNRGRNPKGHGNTCKWKQTIQTFVKQQRSLTGNCIPIHICLKKNKTKQEASGKLPNLITIKAREGTTNQTPRQQSEGNN